MAVTGNLIGGSALTQTDTAIEKTQIWLVNGLSGTDAEKEYEALTAGGVPVMGDALGSAVPLSNVQVVEKRARPASGSSTTQMEVAVRYSSRRVALANPSDTAVPVFESSSSLASEVTDLDMNGAQVKLTYTFAADHKSNTAETTQTVPAYMNVLKPEHVETMRRIESGVDPRDIARAYLGKTNSAVWFPTIGNDADSIGTWLCTVADGRSPDGGSTWEMTYQFAYRPDGWTKRVVFEDPTTGKPVTDPVDGTSFKNVTVYGAADFTQLNLLGEIL